MKKLKTLSNKEGKLVNKKDFVPRVLDKKEKEDKKFKPKKFEDFFKEQNLDSWLKNGAKVD